MATESDKKFSFSAKDIGISFGGLRAVSNFNFSIATGELKGLIGPNGAGKTTVFNLITGVYEADTGSMTLGQDNLLGLKPYDITKRGIARTFQNIRLFADLPVIDNVMVSFHMAKPYAQWEAILRTRNFLQKEQALRSEALHLLDIMGLANRAEDRAGSLSYGDQRRVEIARALAAHPKLLLLDEPAAGLNTQEKVDLMKTVANIRSKFNVAILLIEHDMKLVMGICERITVLDHGEVIAEGTPREIQENPRVIEAYLGAPDA